MMGSWCLPLQGFVAKSPAGRFCSGGFPKKGAAYRAMGLPAFQEFSALSLLRYPAARTARGSSGAGSNSWISARLIAAWRDGWSIFAPIRSVT